MKSQCNADDGTAPKILPGLRAHAAPATLPASKIAVLACAPPYLCITSALSHSLYCASSFALLLSSGTSGGTHCLSCCVSRHADSFMFRSSSRACALHTLRPSYCAFCFAHFVLSACVFKQQRRHKESACSVLLFALVSMHGCILPRISPPVSSQSLALPCFFMTQLLILPLITTSICRHYDWTVDFAPSLFISTLVFPLSFAMNAAYTRREQALQYLAHLKASALSLHLCHKAWCTTQHGLPEQYVMESTNLIKGVFLSIRGYLVGCTEEHKDAIMFNLYQQFTDIMMHTDMQRLSGLQAPLLTRPQDNLRMVMECFERLRMFSDYRTPASIRSFCKMSIVVAGVFLGPWFANVCERYGATSGYCLCVVFFWLLSCMSSIQVMLENPYLTASRYVAEDDINLESLRSVIAVPVNHRRNKKILKRSMTRRTSFARLPSGGTLSSGTLGGAPSSSTLSGSTAHLRKSSSGSTVSVPNGTRRADVR